MTYYRINKDIKKLSYVQIFKGRYEHNGRKWSIFKKQMKILEMKSKIAQGYRGYN